MEVACKNPISELPSVSPAVERSSRSNDWTFGRLGVHLFAWLTLAATFLLICSGGLVTSKGVGMAVPDWPTTYGYNMFLFPVSRWVDGIFYEHTHRLLASFVGFLTMILAVWLLVVEQRRWVKVLGSLAFVAVVVQGLIGGLRVTLYADWIGIFHGILAQAFLVSLAWITLATSRKFIEGKFLSTGDSHRLRWFAGALVLFLFVQLALGASMRHAHAGLAVPDFPTAYGQLWPSTSPEVLANINTERRADNQMPTSGTQIHLHMLHRVLAFGIFLGVACFAWAGLKTSDRLLRWLAAGWMTLILIQFSLGAWTVWSNKAADVATAHVAVGALCLLVGFTICVRLFVPASHDSGQEVVRRLVLRKTLHNI